MIDEAALAKLEKLVVARKKGRSKAVRNHASTELYSEMLEFLPGLIAAAREREQLRGEVQLLRSLSGDKDRTAIQAEAANLRAQLEALSKTAEKVHGEVLQRTGALVYAALAERNEARIERDDLSAALDSARQQIEAITVDRRAIIDAQGQEHWESVRDRRRAELETQEGMAHANREIADLRGERNQLLGKLGASNGLLGEAHRERDEARAAHASALAQQGTLAQLLREEAEACERNRQAYVRKGDRVVELEAALTSQQRATEEAMRRAEEARRELARFLDECQDEEARLP